jgi:hypothetical protein
MLVETKATPKYKQSPSVWLIFTLQSTAPLKDIRRHPRVSAVLAHLSCRLIHHQWSVDTVDTTSYLGFFVGETPWKRRLGKLFEKQMVVERL